MDTQKLNNKLRISLDEQLKIIELWNNKYPINKISKETGKCFSTIRKVLHQNGIKWENRQIIMVRKYEINHDLFEIIDSENKAYWLGFIAADGHITRNGIKIVLALKDIDQLEKFKMFLNSNHPIKIFSIKSKKNDKIFEYCRINIHSKKIKNNLISLGIIERKSLLLKPPNLPKNLILPFVRGYFDGDGGFTEHIVKKNNQFQTNATFTSTKEMCDYIEKFLREHGFNVTRQKRFKDTKNNYTISVNGNFNIKLLGELLYGDANIFLNRKYNQFQKLKAIFSKIKNKNYYIYDRNGKFYYEFVYMGTRYTKYGFSSRESCFSDCLAQMKKIGYVNGIRKLLTIIDNNS